MLAIIGTYRGTRYVPRLLESINCHVSGITRLAFVDDSGEPQPWLSAHGDVSQTLGAGYNAAMQEVCRLARELAPAKPFAFIEEDFTFSDDVDLEQLGAILMKRPHLAQIALLRGPHFPIEHAHGGLLEGLTARLGPEKVQLEFVDGIWEQRGTFTCNPSVWRPEVAQSGWPRGRWSEDRKRDELLAAGYRFGFLPGVKVTHDGIRSGHGY